MRSYSFLILWGIFANPVPIFAQSEQTPKDSAQKRIVYAIRVTNPIVVDGLLDEDEYNSTSISGFLQHDPDEGKPATQKTEVWISYDDAALYFGARMHDTHPDSIVTRLVRRDVWNNDADLFYVGIDSYNDKRSGFFFGVYPSGSVIDGIMYNDSWDDDSWDGVWDAATTTDNGGWNVEMRIPYSQLRFPKQEVYVWGINFARRVERRKEESHWSLIKKGSGIWVSGFGELHHITGINPPPRVEVLPYVATSTEALVDEPGNPFKKNIDFFGNAGADLKLGLGSNLTLNATINPDFGQVEVDPAVVNLTQFETFFEEKRPFFIEGSDYFSFGQGGANNNWGFNWGGNTFFYSRRVGRSPQRSVDGDFTDIPKNTTILGAAKITGKLSDDWSFGSLHALTEREYGRADTNGIRFNEVVEPFSYYGVVRSRGEFSKGKYGVGFIGTGAIHDVNQSYLRGSFNKRAFSYGVDGWAHLDSAKEWVVTGWLAGSHINGDPSRMIRLQRSAQRYYQRPDQNYVKVDSSATALSGYAIRFALNKQKGNFYTNAAFGVISPGFDINDLGIMFRADVVNAHLVLGYRWYEPDGFFRKKFLNVATARNFDFGGRRTNEGYFLFSDAQFMNYWGMNFNLFFFPQYVDTRATRGGPAMLTTQGYGIDLGGYTDSGKDVSGDIYFNYGGTKSGGYRYQVSPGVEFRPASNFFLRFSPDYTRDVTIAQWVENVGDASAAHTFGTRHVFGRLDQQEVSAVFRMNWTFTPKLSLQVFVQPLISVGRYDQFKELKQPLTYSFNNYGENASTIVYDNAAEEYTVDPDGVGPLTGFSFSNPDFNFKSLRANAILRWEYFPGSTLYFAWTHGHINTRDAGDFNPFFRDIGNLFRSEPDNVFLVKIAYWLTPSAIGL
jgi:hypothetical protein